MIKELLTILESKTDADQLVATLTSPRGTKVYEYEVDPHFIDITVDHDMPEHALSVGIIKTKFGKIVSKFTVNKGEGPATARRYHVTLKNPLPTDEVHKISKALEKATKWRKA